VSGAGEGRRRDLLEGWREHILIRVLRWGTVLLFLPWLLGTWAALDAGLGLLAAITTLAYLLLLGITASRRVAFRFRAGGLLLICWGVGVAVLVLVGPMGAGIVWLAAVPVLACFLFGLPGAAWGIAAVTCTSMLLAVLAGSPLGLGPPEGVGPGIRYDLPSWLATAGSVVGLGALLSIPFALLLGRTASALEHERESREALEAEALRREALEARLEQARRLESLGTFAGGIAHDFNNLLVPILGEAEELTRGLPSGSPEAEAAGDILASATRARELVWSILAFSRAERDAGDGRSPEAAPGGRASSVGVGAALKEVGAQLRRSVPDGVTVVTEDRTGGMSVASDALRIHQLLMNLASNGWLAMEEGGGILRIEAHPWGEAEGAAGTVRLVVEDDGVGMDAETVRRAFDPFFTTRPPGKGTGLGLSTVHGIVGMLGGEIHIASEPGRGTRVEVILPAAVAEPPPAGAVPGDGAEPVPERPGGTPANLGAAPATVLLVDDDPAVRTTTARGLSRLGFAVRSAEGGEEALDLLADAGARGESVPVVLTDLTMPGLDGLALAREVRSRYPETRVILVTGNLEGVGDAFPVPGAAGSPVAAILNKPFHLRELGAVLREVLETPAPGGGAEPEGAGGL
jgi:signal transduction histidine kinase